MWISQFSSKTPCRSPPTEGDHRERERCKQMLALPVNELLSDGGLDSLMIFRRQISELSSFYSSLHFYILMSSTLCVLLSFRLFTGL